MTTELATETKSPVGFGSAGLQLRTLDDAWRFSTCLAKSGLAPKGIETPEAILIAVQMGAELGLAPMQSMQNIAVINGRPAIYGDAALALVRGSGLLAEYKQGVSGEGDKRKASVTVQRKGEDPITQEFSVADAKKAGLWGKSGPWTQYPDRMLVWRARGFALRDAFGDVLKGTITVDEAQDTPAEPERNVTPQDDLASVIGAAPVKAKVNLEEVKERVQAMHAETIQMPLGDPKLPAKQVMREKMSKEGISEKAVLDFLESEGPSYDDLAAVSEEHAQYVLDNWNNLTA